MGEARRSTRSFEANATSSTTAGIISRQNPSFCLKRMETEEIYDVLMEQTGGGDEEFYEKYFNSYLNFHRPCGVPQEVINAKGKVKRIYRWYATPWEILRQLPGLAGHLKPDVTAQDLEGRARAKTDTEAATEMQTAKRKLFASFPQRRSA